MKKIIIFLCLLWMGFIFYMSSNNGQISHAQSNKVVSIIENTQEKLEGETGEAKINTSSNSNSTSKSNEKNIKIQQENENSLDHIIRKNAHAFMYMILAILVSGGFFAYNKRGKSVVIYILFICLFYAVTDEFHQSFVPGRTSYVSDILIDFEGALIGLIFFYLFYYKIYTYKKSTKCN